MEGEGEEGRRKGKREEVDGDRGTDMEGKREGRRKRGGARELGRYRKGEGYLFVRGNETDVCICTFCEGTPCELHSSITLCFLLCTDLWLLV